MRRRHYLALSTSALTALVVGCTGDDTDDEDGQDDGQDPDQDDDQSGNENGNGDAGDGETVQSFRETLEAEGYEVLDAWEEDGVVTLEYQSDAADDDAVVDEAAPIMEAFADKLEGGWDVDWLEVWLMHDDGSENADYTVMASSVRDWRDGELSDGEFFDQIREEVTQS